MLRTALIGVSLAACSSPPPEPPLEPPRCVPNGSQLPAPSGFGALDAPIVAELLLGADCEARDAFDVHATVVDDRNEAVATLGLEKVWNAGSVGAKVTFHAARPGWHHVAVRVDPNLGTVQQDVLVAADGRDAEVVRSISSAELAGCERYELTPAGNVLCLAPTAELHSGSSTQLLAMAPMFGSSLAGGVLWLVEAGQVRRLVERGDGDGGWSFVPTATFAIDLGQLVPFEDFALAATGLGVVVLSSDGTTRMTPNEPRTRSLHVLWSDGRQAVADVDNGHCYLDLDAGAAWRCTFEAPSPLLGIDAFGIWSRASGSRVDSLQLNRADDTAFLPLPFGLSLRSYYSCTCGALGWESSIGLFDGGQAYLPSYRRGTFAVTGYGPGVVSASSRWVALGRDGGIDFVLR